MPCIPISTGSYSDFGQPRTLSHTFFFFLIPDNFCHDEMGCTHHLQIGNPKPQLSAPYKNGTTSTLPHFFLAFPLSSLQKGVGKSIFPLILHHPAWLQHIAKYQRAEFSFDSGKLQGTSHRRHLHNANEPEISLRIKRQEAFLIATLSLQLASTPI